MKCISLEYNVYTTLCQHMTTPTCTCMCTFTLTCTCRCTYTADVNKRMAQ